MGVSDEYEGPVMALTLWRPFATLASAEAEVKPHVSPGLNAGGGLKRTGTRTRRRVRGLVRRVLRLADQPLCLVSEAFPRLYRRGRIETPRYLRILLP